MSTRSPRMVPSGASCQVSAPDPSSAVWPVAMSTTEIRPRASPCSDPPSQTNAAKSGIWSRE